MRKLIAVVFAAGLVLAACGGDDGGEGTTTGGDNCVDLSSGADFRMTMQDNTFDPDCLTAKNTQKLDIENLGNNQHTFTIDGTPVDVTVDAGTTQELPAPGDALAPGEYTFYCRFHGTPDGGGMAGTITVT